jgi:hypothetical protein
MDYPQFTHPQYNTYTSQFQIPEHKVYKENYAGESVKPNILSDHLGTGTGTGGLSGGLPEPVSVTEVEISSQRPSSYSTFKGIIAGISTFTILEVIRTIFF